MDIQKEREAFENHLKKMGKTDNETFSKNEDDSYQMDIIHFGWKIWQAAIARMEVRINTLDEILLNQGEALAQAKAQAAQAWISAEVGSPIKFGTRVKIKRKSWDEEDNLIYVESEATYDKDSDFCELSNRTHEYETWFDHELNRYLDEDELTHWAPMDKSESGAEG
ncbi:hypothetical protein [Acinetobacter pittii]|uniref:hypothetical protein n=1 Tax=Acinetobacter pittii TaxID=48296 RepID=UPI001D180CD5|nr:hypothetical protein [Acinetobacter pittii]